MYQIDFMFCIKNYQDFKIISNITVIPEDKILPLWRKQNNISAGEFANPCFEKMENSENCRIVSFAADAKLMEQIEDLGGVTYLGFSKVIAHTKTINPQEFKIM